MLAEGEFAQVQQQLEAALKQRAEWVGDHDLYAMLADAAVQQNDAAALQRYAPLAEESANRYGHTLYQAIAQRAWGAAHRLVGEYAAAETRLRQALEMFEGLEARWQMGRTLVELGKLAQAQKEAAQAKDYITQALAIFEAIGAIPDVARIQQDLN